MKIVTPDLAQVSLPTKVALEFCSSVLRKEESPALATPDFEEYGLVHAGELTKIGADLARAVSNASTYFHCASVRPGTGYELHIWASLAHTLCLRIKGGDATLWMIDACEVLPLLADISGFAPRPRQTASMPLLCRREVWELLAKGSFDNVEKLISLLGPPFAEAIPDEEDETAETQDFSKETAPTPDSAPRASANAPLWNAVVLERIDTREEDRTQLHISTLERVGFISTPTQLFLVDGIETHAAFSNIVTLMPTSPYDQWGTLTRISEVAR